MRAERQVRNAAHYRKQARRSSDASSEATASLCGGLASVDGIHSKAINHRPAFVGNGFASAGQRPMDLQEIYRERGLIIERIPPPFIGAALPFLKSKNRGPGQTSRGLV